MFKKIYEFYLFINPTFKFYRDLDTEYGQVNNNDNVNNNPKVCGDNFLNQNKEKEMFDRYNIFIKIYREDDYIKKLRKEILESNGIISNIGVRGLDSLKNNRTIVAYDDITVL